MGERSEEADTQIDGKITGAEIRTKSGGRAIAFRRSIRLGTWTGAFRPAICLRRVSAKSGFPTVRRAISRRPAHAGNCGIGFRPELSWSEGKYSFS